MSSNEGAPELCDLCGAVVGDDTELYALLPDSSAVHARDPALDGKRLVSACCKQHLDELAEQYRRRRFVEAEQWAGKVLRAVEANPGQHVDDAFLSAETGLTAAQIHAGIAWHNKRARRIRKRRRRS